MSEYFKPLPKPTPSSRPFWEAAKKHELKLQKCGACYAPSITRATDARTAFPISSQMATSHMARQALQLLLHRISRLDAIILPTNCTCSRDRRIPDEGPTAYLPNVMMVPQETVKVGMPVTVCLKMCTPNGRSHVWSLKFKPA